MHSPMPDEVSRWNGSSLLSAPARPGLGEVAELALGVVVEAPDARVRAVVMVEGAVFLHQEHDVLNGAEVRAGRLRACGELCHGGAGAVVPAGRGEDRPAARRQRGSEHGAAVEARAIEAHVLLLHVSFLTWAPRPLFTCTGVMRWLHAPTGPVPSPDAPLTRTR